MNTQAKKNEILNEVYKSKDGLSWNELTQYLNELIALSKEDSFAKLSDYKPEITGQYEVITNRGRIININGEKFLDRWIWETNIDTHNINEEVIAWRFLN